MRNRCTKPTNKRWRHYGGRGIKICDEWLSSFEEFYKWAIANGYQSNLTLDRSDNNGDYCPTNCRWVNWTVQARNRQNTNLVSYKGKTQVLMEWANELNINLNTLQTRIYQYKWSVERALSTPPRTSKP